jgi:hypothetical protein
MSDPPLSSFMKLIVSTPGLLGGLHTMSQAKAIPKGLKDRKCKKITLHEPLQFPMSPRKTLFKRRCLLSRLRVAIPRLAKVWNFKFLSGNPVRAKHFSFMWDLLWRQSGKGDTSRPTKKPTKPVEQHKLVKQAKATLAKLDGTTSKGTETSKKPSKRHKEAAATADTPEPNL